MKTYITSSVAPNDNMGGLFRQIDGAAVVLKNVVMKVPTTDKNPYGFVTAMVKKGHSVTVENCHFIGGKTVLCGLRTTNSEDGWGEASVTGTTYEFYKDVKAFNDAYSGLSLTKELEGWCEEYLSSTPKSSTTV